MASIMYSARIQQVKALCGHLVPAYIPPGNLGPVGRRNIEEAKQSTCPACR